MTHRNTWKQRERDIAKFFESERTPLSGGNSKHTRSDTLSKVFYVEAKYRVKQATASLFRDTAQKAKLEGKIPIVALCEKVQPGFLIVTSQADFARVAMKFLYEKARSKLKGKKAPCLKK